MAFRISSGIVLSVTKEKPVAIKKLINPIHTLEEERGKKN